MTIDRKPAIQKKPGFSRNPVSWTGVLPIAFAYSVIAVVMTWPLAAHLGTRLASDLGDPAFNSWVIEWDAGQLLEALRGHLGALGRYWHGNIFYPEPLTLAYSEHLTAEAVEILPIYAATGNILIAYNVLFISTFVGSGLAVYLLVRDLTNRPLAAFLAGVAFAYAPYRMGQFSHIQVISSYWMPFALFGFHRYFVHISSKVDGARARLALAGAAAAIVLQNLSCGYYMLFFAPFVVPYCLYEMTARRLLSNRRVWTELGAAAAVVGLCTWPFVRPYFALRDASGLGTRSLAEIVMFSADTHAYATAASGTRLLGPWLTGFFKAEGEGFPGFTIIAFAAIGVAWGLARAIRAIRWSSLDDWLAVAIVVSGLTAVAAASLVLWFFVNGRLALVMGGRTIVYQQASPSLAVAAAALGLCLALVAFARRESPSGRPSGFGFFALAAVAAALLALGPRMEAAGRGLGTGPYYWFLAYVPGFDGLRVPARMLMLVALFLSVLVGLGSAALLATRARRVAAAIVAVGMVGILAEAWVVPISMNLPVLPEEGLMLPPNPAAGRRVNPIYEVIRQLPGSVVLLEFPFGDPAYEVMAVFYAGHHRRPLVNGYSGFFPRTYTDRVPVLRDVPNDPVREAAVLGESGATHVLVHESAFTSNRGRQVSDWLVSIGASLVTSSGRDKLFALK